MHTRHPWEEMITIKTLHGIVRGRTIELDQDPGVLEGQEVGVQMRVVEPPKSNGPEVSQGLAEIYAMLGERYQSGLTDTAQWHTTITLSLCFQRAVIGDYVCQNNDSRGAS